jgi:hypothetical protein
MGKFLTYTDILLWNARGIKSKKYEFLNYLEANSIPIALNQWDAPTAFHEI